MIALKAWSWVDFETFKFVAKWDKKDSISEHATFLEISDCHNSVRLHKIGSDSKEQFIIKLKLLEEEVRKFREHLELALDWIR